MFIGQRRLPEDIQVFKKIVIATDGSDHAEKAVRLGADIAAKYGAEVVIVHALLGGEVSESLVRMAEIENLLGYVRREPRTRVQAGQIGAIAYETRSAEDEARSYRVLTAIGERILATAESIAREHGAERVATHLANGDPTTQILNTAESEHADLIVCGARGLSDLRALMLGSVSHKLSHLAPVTCITVR